MNSYIHDGAVQEPIPDFAFGWRPFANRDLIRINARGATKAGTLVIDPWTQRWIVAEEPVVRLLELADGVTRFSQILRDLYSNVASKHPKLGYAALAQQLAEHGLLFNCRESHRDAGGPVYNESMRVGIHLEVTNACNMTCEHCYVASGKKLADELSLDEIKLTVDMLPAFTGKRIALSGGEPAVRKDIAEIIDYCVLARGHDVDLYTNGKKFPRVLAEHIRDINRRSQRNVRIQVSLEGATAATNDAVRGSGSWTAAQATLDMFGELGLNRNVVLFVCLTRDNIGELDQIIKLAEERDVGMLVFSQWQKQGNASNTPWESLAPDVANWVEAGEKVLAYRSPRLTGFRELLRRSVKRSCGAILA